MRGSWSATSAALERDDAVMAAAERDAVGIERVARPCTGRVCRSTRDCRSPLLGLGAIDQALAVAKIPREG
jgi:hypothetical protein